MALSATPMQRTLLQAAAVVIFVLTSLYFLLPLETYAYIHDAPLWHGANPPGPASNATLGFHKIFTLTKGTPWRIEGLREAAEYTGLDVDYTPQADLDEAELDRFIDGHDLGRGAAAAWFGHLTLLRQVQQQGLGSALIMEDDMDFDVDIKHEMLITARGIRELMSRFEPLVRTTDSRSERAEEPQVNGDLPYGRGWDVLWLGHCGEHVAIHIPRPGKWTTNGKIQMWYDRSVVPQKDYTGHMHNSVGEMPAGTRAAIRALGPVCSFAYAVNSESVAKVLEKTGQSRDGGAFDVVLHDLCGNGELRCISVVPELFHQYTPPQTELATSEVGAADGSWDMAKPGEVLKLGMGFTLNIVTSARCASMYNDTCFPGRMDKR